MSTKVLESSKGWASSIALRISPWQYNGESQGAVIEPLMYRPRALDADTTAKATARSNDMMAKIGVLNNSRRYNNTRLLSHATIQMEGPLEGGCEGGRKKELSAEGWDERNQERKGSGEETNVKFTFPASNPNERNNKRLDRREGIPS